KDKIGGFHHQQSEEQRGRHPVSVALDKEVLAFKVLCDREETPENPEHHILFRIDIRLAAPEQADAAVNQDRAKNVDDEFKALEQRYADQNKDQTHYQRAQHSPDQNFVLRVAGHAEVAEENQENEEVIDAQRLFDHISGHELEHGSVPMPQIHQAGKGRCQQHPENCPADRLPEAHRRTSTMQANIQRQHGEDKQVEANPEQPGFGHAGVSCESSAVYRNVAIGFRLSAFGQQPLWSQENLKACLLMIPILIGQSR